MRRILYCFISLFIVHSLEAVHYHYGYIVKPNARGKDGKEAYACQDAIGITAFPVDDGEFERDHVAIVLADGHGKDGGLIAREAVDYYLYLLQRTLDLETQHPQFEKLLNLTSLQHKDNLIYGTQVHKMILGRVSEYLDSFYAPIYVTDQVQASLTGQILHSGTTLTGYVLDDEKAYLFNVGDSRTIIIRDKKLFLETKDHKPSDSLEAARITKAGHTVINGRAVSNDKTVSYGLSRSFGDLAARNIGLLSCEPDDYTITVKEGDYFITASDGLWDVLSSQDVIAIINHSMISSKGYGHTCKSIAVALANKASALGSVDDISVIVTYVSK